MKRKELTNEEQMLVLLQNLVAIEQWRGGLPQAEIAKRLGVATGTVSGMLKGMARHITTLPPQSK